MLANIQWRRHLSPRGLLSVIKLDWNPVEITADLDSYVDNHPRTSYITIKANNVTK